MRIREFTDKYCLDIVKKANSRKLLLDNDDFPYDAIYTDEYGQPYKIIYTSDGKVISLSDILSNTEEDFRKIHPTATEIEAYDNYIEGLIIIEGEDAVFRIRNELSREQDRLSAFTDILEI